MPTVYTVLALKYLKIDDFALSRLILGDENKRAAAWRWTYFNANLYHQSGYILSLNNLKWEYKRRIQTGER